MDDTPRPAARPAARHVIGHRPADLVGARLSLYTHPDDATPLMQAVERLRQEAEPGDRGPGRHVFCRVRAADGGWRHVESTISLHPEGLIFSSRDVTERVALQAQLERRAFHDALTGLPNRALFTDRVAHALRKRTVGTTPPAVLFLDLDGFQDRSLRPLGQPTSASPTRGGAGTAYRLQAFRSGGGPHGVHRIYSAPHAHCADHQHPVRGSRPTQVKPRTVLALSASPERGPR
ncbi:diguanylate cyclase domain-containing protein [Streptomyces mirabilis]|uniref:diguanylate cyclase domain-containing protein n=1 Tax=Streptomyces mirabilis TaxID=68239 RepID=UPI0036BAF890